MMILRWANGQETMMTCEEFDTLYFSYDIEEDYPISLVSAYCVF